MQDDDSRSFSVISTEDAASVYAPTEQDTDEFELLYDNDAGSEGSQWGLSSSCSTSVPPSIHGHEYESGLGRRYHSYRSGRYPLPNDAGEQLREETEHALMLHLLGGRLFLSELGDNPRKIIDIGTGTGTWAIDVADLYQNASVIGTDLSPIQPRSMPLNARMFIEDCEDPEWKNGHDFDLVHFRGVAGFLHDLEGMVIRAHQHIRPGGWIEFQEFDKSILCDDGTMDRDDDPLRLFFDICAQGMRQYGCAGYGAQDIRRVLKQAGFKNIQVLRKKVPISSWPQDKTRKTMGTLMKANILESLDALAAKPMVALGMTPEEREDSVNRVRGSIGDPRIHRYMNCCIYWGQKDDAGTSSHL